VFKAWASTSSGMVDLFAPYTIRDLQVRNRFMRSATTSAYAREDGTVHQEIIALYRGLARGGVGLIVKGHLYVSEDGKAHRGMAGISSDIHIPGLRRLTDAVHEEGGHIFAQLNHAGVVYEPDRKGPSRYAEDDWVAREMTEDEIWGVVEAFGDASERALAAGFDGVQIHGAHGYLISQFLSRRVNRREDEWGGSLENRMRLLLEVYDEVRGRTGNSPVAVKINCDDFNGDAFTVEDSVEVAKALSDRGVDLIEISGGGRGARPEERGRAQDPEFPELAFAGHAKQIKKAVGRTPVALVNGFTWLSTMRRVVELGLVDVVSLSRPFIREPDLVKRLEGGQERVSCERCDACRASFGVEMLWCRLEGRGGAS